MVVPQGKYNILEVVMLDYKSIVRLKRLGLNNSTIASNVHCKWDSVQRIVARCESVWGSVDGVPENLSNEEIKNVICLHVTTSLFFGISYQPILN